MIAPALCKRVALRRAICPPPTIRQRCCCNFREIGKISTIRLNKYQSDQTNAKTVHSFDAQSFYSLKFILKIFQEKIQG